MKTFIIHSLLLGFLIEIAVLCSSAVAGPLQSVSVRDPNQAPPAGGGGDSLGPIISPDGRYVLFASTANNLVLLTNNTPLPRLIPPKLNVFLRDRTNGTTTLVSANLSGTGGGNGDSLPVAISTNGQYVLFESSAGDLVPGDTNGYPDIFVRNLASNTTVLVSVSTNGGPANGASRESVMTPDGRYVAFTSEASNLVPSDTNRIADIFVRDLQSGTTTLASVGASPSSTAGGLPYGSSEWPEITPDGRYVAFSSTATNLVPGNRNTGDIYVRDLVGGTTVWASAGVRPFIQSAFNTLSTNIVCQSHAISAGGQYVAFEARVLPPTSSLSSTGLVFRFNVQSSQMDTVNTNAGVSAQTYDDPGNVNITPDGQFIAFVGNTNVASSPSTCILVWSAQSGTTTLASINLSNSASAGAICDWPVIDPTGRFVAFQSTAPDLTTNSLLGAFHLFVRDLLTDTTTLVDADTNGVGSGVGPDAVPSLSANGPSVAFSSFDGNLVPNDRNRAFDVLLRDVGAGTNELISACPSALSSLTPNGLSTMTSLSVSANARCIAFTSDSDNLVPNDTNGWRDVFLRDTLMGTNLLVSAATNGGVGNDESFGPSISGDGRYVAFTSSASNLVAGDLNNLQDVFVRDTQSGTTILASVNTNGLSGNGNSSSAIIASNGFYVLFQSTATDLAPGTYTTASQNLFLRDLQGNTTYALTLSGVSSVTTTPNGRYVFYVQAGSGAAFYIWDTQAMHLQSVYSSTMIGGAAASIDGNVIAYQTLGKLAVLNRASNTTWLVTTSVSNYSTMNISSDGRWLVYSTAPFTPPANGNLIGQVYLYDLVMRTNLVVSQGYSSGLAANGASDSPTISSNGRFIAYRSTANNLVPNVTNGARSIYLYDRTNASTTLITVSQLGNTAADSHSMTPVFSGDGQTLVFQSWSSDLVAQDANFNGDVFAYAMVTNAANQPFFAQIVAGSRPGVASTISWTAVPGKTYSVQYKNNATDAFWLNITGGVTIVGSQGFFTDPSPSTTQRFYRVAAF